MTGNPNSRHSQLKKPAKATKHKRYQPEFNPDFQENDSQKSNRFSSSSPFRGVNPFPQQFSHLTNQSDASSDSFEERFPPNVHKSNKKDREKELEIFNNMKRQFEYRINNLPMQSGWKDSGREDTPPFDMNSLSKFLLLPKVQSQVKKQEEEIAELNRELKEVRSKNVIERKELENEKRRLEEEKESIQTKVPRFRTPPRHRHLYERERDKRRPRSSTEDELELERQLKKQLDIRWSNTEVELQKRFDQMESLKNGLLSMQDNLRKDALELERKNKEHEIRARQLDRLVNPKQFIERERKLASREKDVKRREDSLRKTAEQSRKRKELLDSRNAEIDRRLLRCKELEEKLKGERDKLDQEKNQGSRTNPLEHKSKFFPRHNITEERARLFQKETMLLQKERVLSQREQSLQERESKNGKNEKSDAQKIAQENLDAAIEELMKQKEQVALQLDEVLSEKKKLQDLRRLTHRAQTSFDRESKKERIRLANLEEKLNRVQESFGDHKDIVLRIAEQEEELARRGEELLVLYEDIQDQEQNVQLERQKLRQEQLKFKHEKTMMLHSRSHGADKASLAKMKEMHKELKIQVNAMKELKTQISHLIVSEQIDWVRFPELRAQVLKLTKVDPLTPPISPSPSGSSSRKSSKSSFDRSVKYESPRSSPRSRFNLQETKKAREFNYEAHSSPYYSFKAPVTRQHSYLYNNPLIGYE